MKNDSAKNLIIIVLLIIVVLLTIAVVYNVTTGKNALNMFVASDNKTTQENVENVKNNDNVIKENNTEVLKNEGNNLEDNNENEEKSKYDVSKINWSRETKIEKIDKYDAAFYCSIKDGKLEYYNSNSNKNEIANIQGKAKYIETYLQGGGLYVEVLTTEGEVYCYGYSEGDAGFWKKEVGGKVKEFAHLSDYADGNMYYLLENDLVVDENGMEYNTYHASFGTVDAKFYFKRNSSNIWHIKDETDSFDFPQILTDDKGKDIKALAVYYFDSQNYEDAEFIILTTDWMLMHYNISQQKIVQIEGKISKQEIISSTALRFTTEDEEDIGIRGLFENYFDLDTFRLEPILAE